MPRTSARPSRDTTPTFAMNGGYSTFAPSTAIPEPATWAMMLLGFFGLGALLRRGRRESEFVTV